MALIIILIAAILIVAAIRDSQGDLFNALGQDVPAFVVWGAAIFLVGAIGFIKPLKPVSQGLLVLILLVIVVNNYQAIITGITAGSQIGAGAASAPSNNASPAGSTTQTNIATSSVPSNILTNAIDSGIAAGS
jgi:hypothetical protein